MLKYFTTTLLLITSLSAYSSADTLSASAVQSSLNDSIVSYAKQFIGAPYKAGGKGPSKFDCSGFTGFVFAKFGHTLNASSGSQYIQGKAVKRDLVVKGDLVFFAGRNSKNVGHVGIVCETDSTDQTFSFIHASTHNGVMIDKFCQSNKYYYSRYIGARRVLPELPVQPDEARKDTLPQNDSTPLPDTTIKPEPEPVKESAQTDEKAVADTIRLTVKKGETLYKISKKHDCPIDSLMSWNNLKSSALSIGQKLIILKNVNQNANIAPQKETEEPKEAPKPALKTHIVKKGDTLYKIAKQNNCSIETIKQLNNLSSNNLKIGAELILPTP